MSAPSIQQIVTTYWPLVFPTLGYVAKHTGKVINAIIMCRTPLLGAHRYTCDTQGCGHNQLLNNSCRNRHCPLCQAHARAQWLKQRLTELLPTHYFHVVFTLPSQLRALTMRNKRVVYNIMFKAASQTILELAADPKRLGGKPGIILMMHTWTQRMLFHPHLHGILPGGVLAPDQQSWIAAGKKFFLPVKVVAALFRGKFLAMLKKAHCDGQLSYPDELWHGLISELYSLHWHVYLEPSFRNPVYVVKYLAAYTNRIAIADKRILSMQQGCVRFRYERRSRQGCFPAVEKLEPGEFVGRFLLHILPRAFVKIRYYGVLSNRSRESQLPVCRTLLENSSPKEAQFLRCKVADEFLRAVAGLKQPLCPSCGAPMRITQRIMPQIPALATGGND